MFKKLLFILALLSKAFALNKTTYAQAAPSIVETISSFHSDIVINSDGTVNVTEAIQYYFPFSRHGIFREIPLTKTNQDGKAFRMQVSNISVTDELGRSYMFQDNSASAGIYLKIGDPNATITGTHVYVISYTLSGALTYFSDHDEIYWNVTGNGWEVPINESSVSITLPYDDSLDSAVSSLCYVGHIGSTEHGCTFAPYFSGPTMNIVEATADRQLATGEGLTIVTSFPSGLVEVLEPVRDFSGLWETIIGILIFIGWLIFYILLPAFLFFRIWPKLKKQPNEKKVVAAWFDPPKTDSGRSLTAGEVGVLYDKRGDIRDITATLIQIAQKGFLKITSEEGGVFIKKPKFSLVKVREWEESDLLEYEKYLLDSIFKGADVVSLESLGKRVGFATKLETTYKEAAKQLVEDGQFVEDPYKVRDKWVILLAFSLFFFNPLMALVAFLGSKSARRTESGALSWATIESMRNFVRSQDKQLEFQAQNQMFFEKLLPYAIALGVEKIWLGRFKDLKLAKPEWLETDNFNALSYVYLMNNFNSSVSSAVSMSSTRSSSGFSSGFSGGSSGGGGGGGGGGSW